MGLFSPDIALWYSQERQFLGACLGRARAVLRLILLLSIESHRILLSLPPPHPLVLPPPHLWHLYFISEKKYLDLPIIPGCYVQQDDALYTWSSLGLTFLKYTKLFLCHEFRRNYVRLTKPKFTSLSPGLVVVSNL